MYERERIGQTIQEKADGRAEELITAQTGGAYAGGGEKCKDGIL